MIRRSTIIGIGLSLTVALILFRIKYKVMELETQHKQIKKDIKETEESIHILKAEWAHLNDPKRLQKLAQKYLTLEPIKNSQIISFHEVAGGDKGYDRKALEDLITQSIDISKMVPRD